MFINSSIPTIIINGEDLSHGYVSLIANVTSSQEAIKDGLCPSSETPQGDVSAVTSTKKRYYILRKVIKGVSKIIKALTMVPAKSTEREYRIGIIVRCPYTIIRAMHDTKMRKPSPNWVLTFESSWAKIRSF
ncbi:hypothetical protein BCON_0236g00080 [Botryotinia convoluta]|uniref:Uncharacterized protein n=1 Tax=Botryotinia convoluta TaxID=54673 RepID=A0A4Z1HP96_9HELO|nr:hypothetical protein BCON_0236g00080 [Botryotinia convoluta]